jgi:hypothetical protein
MAVDVHWRNVITVLKKHGWVLKYSGKGKGTAHDAWGHPARPGIVLNIVKHGKDGIVKAWGVQQIMDEVGRYNCPPEWSGSV